MGKKIVALNLALILMVGVVLSSSTAYADETNEKQATDYSQAVGISQDGINTDKNNSLKANLVPASPYLITVGGTSFNSDVNSSGTGWSYNAEENQLDLSGYNGASILSSGDLTIYASGGTFITGVSGANPRSGIAVNGKLNLFFKDILSIKGGNGGQFGGDGIYAKTLNISAEDNESSFKCSGGTGGDYGGCGLYADDIYLDPNQAAITGSAGSNPGYGIVYKNSLYIGVCDMTVQIDYPNGSAIATTGSNPFYYSKWDDIAVENYQITFSVKTYTLTVNGNGGTCWGQNTYAKKFRYPNFLAKLEDYVCSRDGYRQIGWASGSNLTALDENIWLTSNTVIEASWVPVQSNTVLFVGNGGKINGSYYLSTITGSSISVPNRSEATRTDAYGNSMYLLGWTNQLKLSSNSSHVLNYDAGWYLPGSHVSFDSSRTMYAKWASAGNIINYDCNGGRCTDITGSSTGKTQAILSTGSDLTLYVLSDLDVQFQKNDYTFVGWKNDNGDQFVMGQAITGNSSTLTVTNLKAQWAKNCVVYLGGNGGTYTQDGGAFAGVYSYEGKVLKLSDYTFERFGYKLTGWNTKKDGTGKAYSLTDSITLTGDNLNLYAQWAIEGTPFYGSSTDSKDTATCYLVSEQNKVNISLHITSLDNSSIVKGEKPVYFALYKGGRLISIVKNNAVLPANGTIYNTTIYYPATTTPDMCKIFVLDGTNYKPLCQEILCHLS